MQEFLLKNLIAIISAIIAILSAVIAIISSMENKRTALTLSNYQLIFEVERELNEELFELHNVDKEFFSENNITPQQLRYMIRSFHAAAAHYRANGKFRMLSAYRKNLLSNPKVKLMYQKVIREKFLDLSENFILAIDNYYNDNQ